MGAGGAILGAVTSIWTAKKSSQAATSAAQSAVSAEQAMAAKNLEFAQEQAKLGRNDYLPFLKAGLAAMNKLGGYAGIGNNYTMANIIPDIVLSGNEKAPLYTVQGNQIIDPNGYRYDAPAQFVASLGTSGQVTGDFLNQKATAYEAATNTKLNFTPSVDNQSQVEATPVDKLTMGLGDITQNPLYKYPMEQEQKALDAAMRARGMNTAGGTLLKAADIGGKYASQATAQQLQLLSDIMNRGAGFATVAGQTGQNLAQLNAAGNAGVADALSTLYGTQAQGKANIYASIPNAISTYQYLNNLYKRDSYTPSYSVPTGSNAVYKGYTDYNDVYGRKFR